MSADTPKMIFAFIPANAAWAVLMGDTLMDLDGHRLFPEWVDLVYELNERVLKVLADGIVVAKS